MKTIEVKGVAGQCPVCQHPPIRHVQDGTGWTCIVCLFVAGEAVKDAAERPVHAGAAANLYVEV